MNLSKFFHHLFNPHCPDCKDEHEESIICESCEILKKELAIAHQENKRLIDSMLEKPEIEINKEPVQITRPHTLPWKVKQQILEKEDRVKARIMKDAPKPIATEDLEKELDSAELERETKKA